MKWRSGRRSTNVEDRRGRSAPGAAGLVNLLPLLFSAGRRGGAGAVVVALVVLWLVSGGLPRFLVGSGEPPGEVVEGVEGDETADFVSVVLGSTEDVWNAVFAAQGSRYRPPALVLFDEAVASACGYQSAVSGPFYCPSDEKVYLDLGFFRQLAALGGPGDFAAAYVIGHEVGHHVQNLLGTTGEVRIAQGHTTEAHANELSVRLELQADCYAGVWANRSDRAGVVTLSAGDVDEGLEAARAIGDDRLRQGRGGTVHPESFTHGTSQQRARWLRTGLAGGDPASCDTFGNPG